MSTRHSAAVRGGAASSFEIRNGRRELVMTRTFDAPRELLFSVMGDPRHIPAWWGPAKYETTVEKMDVKPGGAWRFVQRDSRGNEHAFSGVYREVTAPERIVYSFRYEAEPDHESIVTITLDNVGGRTKLTNRGVFQRAEELKGYLDSGATDGMNESMDRLDAVLTEVQADGMAGRELTLTRVFDAPRPLVFTAWTDEKLMARWWGPKMFDNPVCTLDVRPGGAIRIDMRGPDGAIYPMTGRFLRIEEPSLLVFTGIAITDAQGEPLMETMNTVTFVEQRGKTSITMRAVVIVSSPQAARPLSGMKEGWTQSLEKLAELASDTSGKA